MCAAQVESLTAARQGAASEPSDTIRAVNALLTQLDQLRGHPNAMARINHAAVECQRRTQQIAVVGCSRIIPQIQPDMHQQRCGVSRNRQHACIREQYPWTLTRA